MALALAEKASTVLDYVCMRFTSATLTVGTGPSSLTTCRNQPLISINVMNVYQYLELVPTIEIPRAIASKFFKPG